MVQYRDIDGISTIPPCDEHLVCGRLNGPGIFLTLQTGHMSDTFASGFSRG